MNFDKRIYINFISNNQFEEAINYRTSNMPRHLYKYISLHEDVECEILNGNCKKFNLNQKKFDSLKDNKLWLSKFENLNDPFEYKAMFLDTEKLKSAGCPIEVVEEAYTSIKNLFMITSFTTTIIDNMPMWAHYANNHKGFCVEYKVNNPRLIFPISYEEDRTAIASIITNYINIANKLYTGEIKEDNLEYQKYVHIFLHNAFIKHKSWLYEEEYRLAYTNFNSESITNGISISLQKLGLEVESIYIGMKCSKLNKNKLIEIARSNSFKVFDVLLDSKEYKLVSNLIDL